MRDYVKLILEIIGLGKLIYKEYRKMKNASKKRLSGRHLASISLIFYVSLILAGTLSLNSCHYDPSLYPAGYDVLIPGPAVDTVGFIDENVIVTQEYIYWVEDLKAEIIRLRKLLEES